MQASLDATYEPGRLSIGAFEITGSGGLAAKGEGRCPLDFAADEILSPGPISIRAQASIPALEELAFLIPPAYAPTGSLRADIAVTGSWKEPDARLEIRGERLQLPAGTRFVPPGPYTLAGTLTWNKAEARADKVRLESPALSLSLSGAWSSPPPSPRSSPEPAMRRRDRSPCAPPSTPRTSAGSRNRSRGSAGCAGAWRARSPSTVRRATRSLPGIYVSRRERSATGICRRSSRSPPASMLGRILTLETVNGTVGGSPFTLAGSVDLSRPDDPTLNLRLQGKDTLLYRDEGLRVRADSDLTLSGPVSALLLSGEVALTNSLYQKSISVVNLFSGGEKSSKRAAPGSTAISFPEPPLRDMHHDIPLTAPPRALSRSRPPGRTRQELNRTCGSPGRACCRSCAARSSSTPRR